MNNFAAETFSTEERKRNVSGGSSFRKTKKLKTFVTERATLHFEDNVSEGSEKIQPERSLSFTQRCLRQVLETGSNLKKRIRSFSMITQPERNESSEIGLYASASCLDKYATSSTRSSGEYKSSTFENIKSFSNQSVSSSTSATVNMTGKITSSTVYSSCGNIDEELLMDHQETSVTYTSSDSMVVEPPPFPFRPKKHRRSLMDLKIENITESEAEFFYLWMHTRPRANTICFRPKSLDAIEKKMQSTLNIDWNSYFQSTKPSSRKSTVESRRSSRALSCNLNWTAFL